MQTRRAFIEICRHGGAGWRAFVCAVAALAVFLSVFHCASAEVQPTAVDRSTIAATLPSASPDTQDQQQPGHVGHCAHCLCHTAYQDISDVNSASIEFGATLYAILQGDLTRPIAGLLPFKPPRA
jgi:hypothetical protein